MRDFAPGMALLLAAAAAAAWRAAWWDAAPWKAALCAALIAATMGLSLRRCWRLEATDAGERAAREWRGLESVLPSDAVLTFSEFSPLALYYLRRPALTTRSASYVRDAERLCGLSRRWPQRNPFLVAPRRAASEEAPELGEPWAETERLSVFRIACGQASALGPSTSAP